MNYNKKCICGFAHTTYQVVNNHKMKCRQWLEYIEMLAKDPKIKEEVLKVGVNLTCKKYGISDGTLRKALSLAHSPFRAYKHSHDSPVRIIPTEHTVELSSEQILKAIKDMLDELIILRERNKVLVKENIELSSANEVLTLENSRFKASNLLKFKVKIDKDIQDTTKSALH